MRHGRLGCRKVPSHGQCNSLESRLGVDLIINLAASGYGVAFEREVVVLTRKHRKVPPHVAMFVENILF